MSKRSGKLGNSIFPTRVSVDKAIGNLESLPLLFLENQVVAIFSPKIANNLERSWVALPERGLPEDV